MANNLTAWQRYSRLKLSLSLYQVPPEQLTASQLSHFSVQLTRQLQIESLIAEQAHMAKLTVSTAECKQAQHELRQRFSGDKAWQQALSQAELSADELPQALMHELLLNKMLAEVSRQVPVIDPERIEQWYMAHQGQFCQPEKRLTHHILLTTVTDDKKYNSAAFAQINGLYHRLLQQPARFAELAKRYSECPTALNEGLLGWIVSGTLYPPLDQHLFSMAENSLSPPIESEMGFHLLHCRTIVAATSLSKSQALALISEKWQQQQKKQYEKQWLDALCAGLPAPL